MVDFSVYRFFIDSNTSVKTHPSVACAKEYKKQQNFYFLELPFLPSKMYRYRRPQGLEKTRHECEVTNPFVFQTGPGCWCQSFLLMSCVRCARLRENVSVTASYCSSHVSTTSSFAISVFSCIIFSLSAPAPSSDQMVRIWNAFLLIFGQKQS